MHSVILITGASSGFGLLTSRALAEAQHTVYAGMRETTGRNAAQVAALEKHARQNHVDLRGLDLDVSSQESTDAAVRRVIEETGRLDVVVHNAGHMAFGPAECFTPEQFAELYDTNVLGAQRLNRAALPQFRKQGKGLLVWVSSTSARGGTPPYLAPYFAAKAAMDSLAVSYAGELTRWGIETSIVVPGAFTKGTNHFPHAATPADLARHAEYNQGPYAGLSDVVLTGLARLEPPEADVAAVAEAIVRVVGTVHGKRPFRVHVDPSRDGCEEVNAVADRVRAELLRRIGLADLLNARQPAPQANGVGGND